MLFSTDSYLWLVVIFLITLVYGDFIWFCADEVAHLEKKKLMKHKLESRLPGEISIISDIQMTPPLWQKVKKN